MMLPHGQTKAWHGWIQDLLPIIMQPGFCGRKTLELETARDSYRATAMSAEGARATGILSADRIGASIAASGRVGRVIGQRFALLLLAVHRCSRSVGTGVADTKSASCAVCLQPMPRLRFLDGEAPIGTHAGLVAA